MKKILRLKKKPQSFIPVKNSKGTTSKLTGTELIQKMNFIHEYKYIYANIMDYSLAESIISIECPIHGLFPLKIHKHLNGQGCPFCARDNHAIKIVDKARLLFFENVASKFNFYNFSKFNYTGCNYPSIVICPIHGEFTRTPVQLSKGNGCQKCEKANIQTSHVRRRIKLAVMHEKDFIKKAIEKFGDAYDYSNIIYVNSRTNIELECSIHGKFTYTPFKHLQSPLGCPKCGMEKSGFDFVQKYKHNKLGVESGIFYILLMTHIPSNFKFIKIGITSKSIEERYINLRSDIKYEIIEQLHDTNLNCAIKERLYKKYNKDRRIVLPIEMRFQGHSEAYQWDTEQQMRSSSISMIREILLNKQNGVCALCGNPPVRPVLDHDHKRKIGGSSYCRGVLCSSCNVLLAKVENNAVRYGITQSELPNILREIALYKETQTTKLIHPTEVPKRAYKYVQLYSYKALKEAMIKAGVKKGLPPFPRNKKLKFTIKMKQLFKKYHINPKFYK